MRTLVGAAEPPDRPEIGPTVTTAGLTSTTATIVLDIIASTGLTVSAWQAVVIRDVYAEPYRPGWTRR